MKYYNYKMQWLLSLNGDFTQTTKQARKKVTDFIKIFTCQSFTMIYFRDKDLKKLDSHNYMNGYPDNEQGNKLLLKKIKSIKPTDDIKYIEFIRK